LEQSEVVTPPAQKVKATMPRVDSAISLDSGFNPNGSRKRRKVELEPQTPVCRYNVAAVAMDTNIDSSTLLRQKQQAPGELRNPPRKLSTSR
jgi:hypothetical protein